MSQLFEELIIEILMRLPVKSLLRFRCVSKSWCALIDSQHFINMNLHHSINTKTNLHVILTDRSYHCPTKIYSLYFDEMFDQPIMPRLNELNNLFTTTHDYEMVGSCNGLICLSNSLGKHFELVLWNPFTRRYKKLPTARGDIILNKRACCGFGYDKLRNDYKVFKIILFFDRNWHLVNGEAMVYSLRSNSWKLVEEFPYSRYNFHKNGCFVNGAIHWLVKPVSDKPMAQGLESSELVVAFNLGFERFCELPLPYDANRGFVDTAHKFHDELEGLELPLGRCYVGLEVLDERLCFCEIYLNFVELWVMEQYGERESWSKSHLLVLDGFADSECDHAKPLAYSKNGDKILLEAANDALTWYDLKKNEDIEHFLSDQMVVFFEVDMCLESLVSVGGGSKFDGTKPSALGRRKGGSTGGRNG